MAELTYDDVRRAAQDAVRDMHGVVNGLKSHTEDIRRNVLHLNPTQSQNQLNDLTNRLNMLQTQITTIDTNLRNHTNSVYTLQTMQQSLSDMHRRLAAMEEFVQFIYRYFNTLQRQTQEDQDYRNM